MGTGYDTDGYCKVHGSTGCKKRRGKRGIQERDHDIQAARVNWRYFNGDHSPLLSCQSFQSHPPGLRYVFLSKLPNEGPRDGPVLQEPTVGTNHHALLAPRKHDIRSSLVLHEPRSRSPDDRDNDVVLFVSLEGVDVEYGVLPGEAFGLQGVLDRIALGVVGSDDSEFCPFVDVTTGYLHGGFDFSFVLSSR